MSTCLFAHTPALEFRHLLAAARRCHPFWERGGRLTFPGGVSQDHAWTAWIDSTWQPVLRPALQEALRQTRRGAFRELCQTDHLLSRRLGEEMSKRSIREGRLLWQSLRPPQGERLLEKLRQALVQRATPGHFLSIYAARATAFSLSDQLACATYIFFEAWPVLSGAPAARLHEWLGQAGLELPAPEAREFLPQPSALES